MAHALHPAAPGNLALSHGKPARPGEAADTRERLVQDPLGQRRRLFARRRSNRLRCDSDRFSRQRLLQSSLGRRCTAESGSPTHAREGPRSQSCLVTRRIEDRLRVRSLGVRPPDLHPAYRRRRAVATHRDAGRRLGGRLVAGWPAAALQLRLDDDRVAGDRGRCRQHAPAQQRG